MKPEPIPASITKTAKAAFKALPTANHVVVRSVTTGKQFAFDRSIPIR